MAESPKLSQQIDLVSYEVLAGGSSVPESSGIYHIEVDYKLNKIPRATIELLDGDPTQQKFEVSDSGQFEPGTEIEIKVGYHQENNTIFKGIVVKIGVKFQNRKHSVLVVECAAKAIKSTLNKKTEYFEDITDKDAITTMMDEVGDVSIEMSGLDSTHPRLVRYDSTPWDFMLTRTKIYGNIVLVDNEKIEVKKPLEGNNNNVKLTFGDDIMKCDLALDSNFQIGNIKCMSWEIEGQQIVEKESQEGNLSINEQGSVDGEALAEVIGSTVFEMHSSAPLEQDLLEVWANGRLQYSRLARITGELVFQGIADIKPNDTISLEKFGNYFDGAAYVSGVFHEIKEGNWTTKAQIGLSSDLLDPEPVSRPSSSSLLPTIEGLYIGLVKKTNEDPDGNTRVLVDIPLLKDGGEGIWARYASNYASNEMGIFFMPEENDEVIIGFLNGDPRFPVVLGSLYSKAHEPPFTPDADNKIKAIVTREQLKLVFDEEKKDIVIETPNGNKITLSDDQGKIIIEDENGNKVETSSEGIMIDSSKDIKMTAKGNIEIKAQGNLKAEATGNTEVKGMSVKAEAQSQLSLKGQIGELNASASLTVKGGIVRIN